MQIKYLSKQNLLLVVITIAMLSLAGFLKIIPRSRPALVVENANLVQGEENLRPTQDKPNIQLPVRLSIPSINVDSIIEYVGLDSEGAMDVPKERSNVAWFDLGARPGESGSAVIAGHYGWQNAKGSVFDDLHKLRKGDVLIVHGADGSVVNFVVRESRRYDAKMLINDSAYIFGSIDGKPHLNLITCEGTWDESTQQYDKRLVVFADIASAKDIYPNDE